MSDAAERLTAYLDEMDRVNTNTHGAFYDDRVHGINDFELRRSDIRSLIQEVANDNR